MADPVERIGRRATVRRTALPLPGTVGFLNFPEAFGFRGFFIVCIQWKTARYQPVSWRGRAIAERPTEYTGVQFSFPEDVQRKLRIGEGHPAQTDKVDLFVAYEWLSDVWQKFLKIRITRTHDNQVGIPRLDAPNDVDLSRDPDEGVFGRLVSV